MYCILKLKGLETTFTAIEITRSTTLIMTVKMEENIIKNSHSDGLQKSPDDML